MTLDNNTRVPGMTPQFGIYISVCVIIVYPAAGFYCQDTLTLTLN